MKMSSKSNNSLTGVWSGYGVAGVYARIVGKIVRKRGKYEARFKVKSITGESEIVKFEADGENNNKASFELIDYVTDNPVTNPPREANVEVSLDIDKDILNVIFVTDIGTHGNAKLRRSGVLSRLIFIVPFFAHKVLHSFVRNILRHFRNIYFLFLVAVVYMSILGQIESRINYVEAAILLLPLMFMYGDKLYQLKAALSLKKLGPVEFEEQISPSPNMEPSKISGILQSEFGDKFPLFSTLTQFFVPKTKSLLRLMGMNDKPVNKKEFEEMAKRLGIPENNLKETLDAMLEAGVISVDSGVFKISGLGREYLSFETRLLDLYKS